MSSDDNNTATMKPAEDQAKRPNKPSETLVKLQAASGLVIAVFTAAHLSNHFVMHFGVDAHRAVFAKLRKVYTAPPVEALLLGSIAVHSGIAVARYEGVANNTARLLFQAAGWFLFTVMPIHVIATRYFGPKAGMKEYDITHAAMAARMVPVVFIPYYAALAASGAVHLLGGLSRAGSALGLRSLLAFPSKGSAYLKWSTVLGALAASSALAVMGVYFKYPMGDEQALIASHLKHWPAIVAKFLELPTSEKWFGSLKWPKSA